MKKEMTEKEIEHIAERDVRKYRTVVLTENQKEFSS